METVEYDFDFFVIGAGSAGVRAARVAAQLGAKVGICEETYFGGTCVNVGCVPKKLFTYAANVASQISDAKGFGWTIGDVSFDWPTLVRNKNTEISRLNGIYQRMLENAGVEVYEARGVLTGAHELRVGDQLRTARHILLGVGGWPRQLTIQGAELAISSNEIFFLDEFPKRLMVVGGGYIGVEFAGVFKSLGAQVTQLYRKDLFLRGFDMDVRTHLAAEMRKKEIDLRFNTDLRFIEKHDDGLHVGLTDGSTVVVDQVLAAIGRVPNTDNLGLGEVGVEMHKGAIVVDDEYRTSVESIFACGDVINRVQLTPVALAEGMAIAHHLFGAPREVSYNYIPSAVFSTPPIATVGLSEEQATDAHGAVDVYRSEFRPLKHTVSGNTQRTLMKLIVDATSDRVVGCHVVGPDACEMIQGFAVALNCGATKAQFDATIGVHPTAAEELVTMRSKAYTS